MTFENINWNELRWSILAYFNRINLYFMKNVLILLFFAFFIQIVYSQSNSKIVGRYHLQSGSHDPQGGVNLIFTDEHQYVFAYFGGMKIGTWKECDGNIIMQPDTTNHDAYYVSARKNPEIPKDSVYISVIGLSESSTLYSFNHSGQKTTMHPVYNKYPNCMEEGRVAVKKGKFDELSLMSVPEIYEDVEYDTQDVDWQEALATYLKDKKRSIEDTDTITGIKYTFPLSASYNEYNIMYNPEGDQFLFPSMGVFKDGKLYINNSVYRKSGDLTSLSDGDQEFIKQLPLMTAQHADMIGNEDDEVTRSQLVEAGFSQEQIEIYLMQLEQKYKAVPYIRKEWVKVDYDLRNIITNTCYEHGRGTRKTYLR